MFVGRETELKFLQQYYESEGSRILVVYGQRGVGKTTLLRHFTDEKDSSYYLARPCSAREQRYQCAGELQKQGIDVPKYPEYQQLFDCLIKDAWGKKIIIIDEFHHLVKSDKTFMPELVRFVEECGQSKPILVILCTSASGWVENSMVGKIGSLALSISGLLKIREFKFREMMQIFQKFSVHAALETYAILGGLPGLWNSFDENLNIHQNIVKHILRKESRLYEEMSVYMSEELREPAVYDTILAAMAKDCNKLNDIYAHTGFSRAKISVYLKNLMELELVEKVFSVESEGHANTQKGIYRISNPYVRFYFRFLFPNYSELQMLSEEDFYAKEIQDAFPLFVEESYRKVCREQLGEQYSVTGEWIGKSGNIDVIGCNDAGEMAAAVCSYIREMTISDYEWLLFCIEKAKLTVKRHLFFCEKGFDAALMEKAAVGEIELYNIIHKEGN